VRVLHVGIDADGARAHIEDSDFAHRLEVVDRLVHGLAGDRGHLGAGCLVERLHRRVRVDAVQQAEDRLALRRDAQPPLPETRREILHRLHDRDTINNYCQLPPCHLCRQAAVGSVTCQDRPVTDHRALVTAPFRGVGLATLESLAEVVLDPWIDQRPVRLYNADQLAERIHREQADVLVVESDFVSGPVFDLGLVAIGSCRGDPNNVDVAGATAAGIPVLRAPGRNANAVAELTVALLLAVTRGIVPADRDVRAGEPYRDGILPYQRYRAWEIAGKTAGIVGLGAVGRAAKWRFEGLGMRVIAHDPYAPDATHSLDNLLAEADVVSMHATVTPETQGMIGAEQFARMRDGSVYLNLARAQLHDTDALVAALQDGPVAAAGLDHFAGERLPADHPLCGLDNVVLTPHIGGATYDTEANHSLSIANGLAALLAGEQPDNLVNPEVLP
jgi:D-3-phosphoglycerate dehydrogenase / 2-oxoglutarate reductase